MQESVAEISRLLAESRLLTAEQIDAELALWRERADGREEAAEPFIEWLIKRELLTDFQGEAILAGHGGPFLLGPYEVHEHIAHGWLGELFRARHVEFDQPVTLKIFAANVSDSPERLARMGRELRIACELDHPNTVRSFEVGNAGHLSYLAMEDLRGRTLAERIERGGPLPYPEACRVVRDLARGLAHLHEREIVLRDIRPENIWLSEQDVPKWMELGGAKDALSFLDTEDGRHDISSGDTVIGEYAYMAPEQAQDLRQADLRSDIYSLGCVLYHCLTGHPPFESENPVRLVMMHATQTPMLPGKLVEGIPPAVDDTVGGMLAKSPAERFQTAEEVAFALDQLLPDEAPQPVPAVVDLNPAYIEWAKSRHPDENRQPTGAGVGVTPELTRFLNWMARKPVRRRKY